MYRRVSGSSLALTNIVTVTGANPLFYGGFTNRNSTRFAVTPKTVTMVTDRAIAEISFAPSLKKELDSSD